MDEEKEDPELWFYKPSTKMNRPIKYMGLSSMELLFVALFAILCFIVPAAAQMPLLIHGPIVIVIYSIIWFAMKRLNTEFKNGKITFLESYLAFGKTPRKIADSKFLFKLLNRKDI